jgi:hypothetical protein
MTLYHINPNASDNTGTGTAASPKKTLSGITLVAGDRVRFLRGTTDTSNVWTTVPGTAAAHIVFEAYANTDGTDNASLPRPIVQRTTPISTYGSGNKNYIDVFDLDFRGDLPVANDTSMIYAGKDATFRNVRVDTNVSAFSSWNNSNVTLENCEFNGVSHSSANNNNLLTIGADNTSIDNIKMLNLTLNHKGGGGTASHVVRADTSSVNYDLTNLVIDGVTAIPPGGAEKNPNTATIGLRLGRCPGVKLRNLDVRGVLSGVFVSGAGAIITGGEIYDSKFPDCYHFGIHLPGGTRGFKIGRNTAWNCGSNMGPSYYGRALEISSSGGQGQNGGHEIFKNSFAYSRNWGGPQDNGSEGCNIGLDDGTDSCYVWGNYIAFGEGNGIQQYGGTGTDTGGHRIIGNYFESNCTASFKNRRSGGTGLTAFNAHCAFSAHKGTPSVVANNVFVGSTLSAISESGDCQNILDKFNNIFVDVRYPITMPPTLSRSANNVFYSRGSMVRKYSNITLDSNGAPTFPAIAYIGENDFTFDPMLDAEYRPMKGSPVIRAGKNIGSAVDYVGADFDSPPTIGMFEYEGGKDAIGEPFDFQDACSILVPIDILNTAGVLTSVKSNGSELPEDPVVQWGSNTIYMTGNRVSSPTTHRVYESLKDNNQGHDPRDPTNRTTAAGVGTWWFEVGPTNRAAMFDGLVSSQTSAPSPLVITLRPGAFNGFAMFGIDADSYSITVKDAPGGNVIYFEDTAPLEGSMPDDYYEYFFSRFKPLTQLVKVGIDPYGSSEITVTLTKGTGDVKLGMFAIGDMRPVGIPQRDATVEPNDFSYFQQDAYGNATVKKRANGTGMSITTKMDKEEAGAVLDTVKQVLGTPVVVVGSSAQFFEWMTVFGLISGSMSPAEFPFATLRITVKGFI